MNDDIYPVLFAPTGRNCEWGGDLLREHFGLTADAGPPSECHQLVDDDESSSVIANGPLAGQTLHDLMQRGAEVMGKANRPTPRFPVRIKFIATGQPIALQLHPAEGAVGKVSDPTVCHKLWYVVAAAENAVIRAELRPSCTQQQLISRLGTPELEGTISEFESIPGDCYFLPSGRIHGLGPGNLILSIEQNNGTSYVLSEAGLPEEPTSIRLDDPDVIRTLVNFKDRTNPRIRGESSVVNRNRKLPLLRNCPKFLVEELRLVNELHDRTSGMSWHALVAIDIPLTISTSSMNVDVKPGQTCLIPAAQGSYSVTPHGVGKVVRIMDRL
jgi:mannose-6-phosphate isomerase